MFLKKPKAYTPMTDEEITAKLKEDSFVALVRGYTYETRPEFKGSTESEMGRAEAIAKRLGLI